MGFSMTLVTLVTLVGITSTDAPQMVKPNLGRLADRLTFTIQNPMARPLTIGSNSPLALHDMVKEILHHQPDGWNMLKPYK